MNRKPLVLVDGEYTQMPVGDLIDPACLPEPEAPPAVDFSLVELENDTAFTRPILTPVYVKSNGKFADADTDTNQKADVVGLTVESIASAASGDVKTSGPIEATTAQWDAQTGGSGGLVAGSDYYLRATGGLSATPAGPHVVKLGKAVSSTKLLLRVEPPVFIG